MTSKRVNLVESIEQDKHRIEPSVASQFIKSGSVASSSPSPDVDKPMAKKTSSGRSSPRSKTAVIKPALIAIHVRVQPEIAAALKSASLDRQLRGVERFSKRDIVEEALEPWLVENGYMES